jgi:hypothetical protein
MRAFAAVPSMLAGILILDEEGGEVAGLAGFLFVFVPNRLE